MRTVAAISPDEAPTMWPALAPMVADALAHADDGYGADDVLAEVRARKAVLWLGRRDGDPEMVAVTQVKQRPRKRVALVWILAGRNLAAWLRDGMGALDAWARAEGCGEWEQAGRDGLTRALPGWTVAGVVMRRPL